MATPRVRSSDIKLIVSATVGVLLAGGLLALGIYTATSSGSKNPTCGQLDVGKADDIRNNLQRGGPYFTTGGAGCGFWLAIDNGNIVAYKVRQPSGCSLNLRDRATRWVCGGQEVDPAALDTYPVSIQTVGTTDAVIVDLTQKQPQSASSTTATTSLTGG